MKGLLHEFLEKAASSDPSGTAVVDGESRTTYGELRHRSLAAARLCQAAGVRPGDRVAILAAKSVRSIAAIYGVLRLGAAYVPIDPESPIDRVRKILSDADPVLVLADSHLSGSAGGSGRAVLDLDSIDGVLPDDAGPGPIEPSITASDPAYILYTSGSTGIPKGVVLSHDNAVGFVEWAAKEFALDSSDRLSSHAPFHFDLSVFDLFAASRSGAAVVLVPPRLSMFPARLEQFIAESAITVWYSVPTVLAGLARVRRSPLPRLRTILFAGEVFPIPALRQLMEALPNRRFANLYGPTETNVCTWHDIPEAPAPGAEPVPIGKAIADTEVWAERANGGEVIVGEVGELVVRGRTVMLGYRNGGAADGDRLRDSVPHRTFYTGDLVRLNEDGSYTFVCRADDQIKRHGYRIEPGEVEQALSDLEYVIEACVFGDVSAGPDKARIIGAVAVKADVSDDRVFDDLRRCLPAYMLPDAIRIYRELPRTSTGKVDKRRLADDRALDGIR